MDNKKYFSIGEVSKLKNVTIKALRYYHDIGLLVPAYINPNNGYRYYSIHQFIYLDIIKICKQSNVSIEETKALFAKANTQDLKLYLERKNKEIHNEIKRLEKLGQRIEILNAAIRSSEDELKNNGFRVQTFEERYFLSLPTQGGELNEIKSFDKLDEKLGESAIHTFQYGVIYSRYDERWEISDVFRLLTSEDYRLLKDMPNVSELPRGEYLTVNSTKSTESETFRSIKEYLEKNRLSCSQIYLLYLVTDIFNPYDHFSQFQMYVKPAL